LAKLGHQIPEERQAKFLQLFLVLDCTKHTRLWQKKGKFSALCHASLQATMKCLDHCIYLILHIGNCFHIFEEYYVGLVLIKQLTIAPQSSSKEAKVTGSFPAQITCIQMFNDLAIKNSAHSTGILAL